MPIPYLSPSSPDVPVQRTSLSVDVLGRFACNTLDEALDNGGAPFDFVVVGAGMFGAYAAAKLMQFSRTSRVLVLDAGPFVVSEHIQNLSRIGYGVFRTVEGQPYLSNVPVVNHYYCIGGKGLGWGKWSPRLLSSDLANWPPAVAQALTRLYPLIEEETGVVPHSDFLFGDLQDRLLQSVSGLCGTSAFPSLLAQQPAVAVQAQPPVSGLYSFDAFSSVPLLLDAVRIDAETSGFDDKRRRIFLVPNARVIRLDAANGGVTALQVHYGSAIRGISLAPSAKVILALGSMETTRLVMNSIQLDPIAQLCGRNLMVHMRSNFDVRISRRALGLTPGDIMLPAALHVQADEARRFHFQIFAATDVSRNPEAILYRMVPDLDALRALVENQRDDWVTMRVLTVGEMGGSPSQPRHSPGTSWCEPAQHDFDNCAGLLIPKLYAYFELSATDENTWNRMDNTALALVQALAGSPQHIEYLVNGHWTSTAPTDMRQYRTSLGSTFHESGTLWMGTDPNTSVTDTEGKFHALSNLYATDQSIFPTVGSANPVLTGLALTRMISEKLSATRAPFAVTIDSLPPQRRYTWKQPAHDLTEKLRRAIRR